MPARRDFIADLSAMGERSGILNPSRHRAGDWAPMMERGKRPRQWAAEILGLPTRKARREYLEHDVPAEFRDWVRFYVEDSFERRKWRINKLEEI